MRFGLMFFAASEEASPRARDDRYRLVVEAARYADRHGFASVWVPERHFTDLGGLYPNPAVLHAALARETTRVALRAGSVVLPLHHPIRVVEEWSMVDNLSGGRVGVSFASGWNPSDFAFFPERYARRREDLASGIETVRRLWRGEPEAITRGDGVAAAVRALPRPVQPELPIWLTAAGNPQTYTLAGELGANLLTHLLDQGVSQLAEKIALYRQARAAAGHVPAEGTVSLMLHTYVGDDAEAVREAVRAPYCRYLESNLGLLQGLARSRGTEVDVGALSPADRQAFVGLLYDRFASARGLIGTPETCLPLVRELADAGVDELACLLDFGAPADDVLAHLPALTRLMDASRPLSEPASRRPAETGPAETGLAETGLAETGPVAMSMSPAAGPEPSLEAIRRRCPAPMTPAALYDRLAAHGVQMAGAFRRIEAVWRRDGEALARLAASDAASGAGPAEPPETVLLDAALQATIAALPAAEASPIADTLYLPSGARAIEIVRADAWTAMRWSHARLAVPRGGESAGAGQAVHGDITIRDADGGVVARVQGLCLSPLRAADAAPAEAGSGADVAGSVGAGGDPAAGGPLVSRWHGLAPPAAGDEDGLAGDWLLLAAPGDRASTPGLVGVLARRLEAAGGRPRVERIGTGTAEIDPVDRAGIARAVDRWRRSATRPRGVLHLASLVTESGADLDDVGLRNRLAGSLATGLHLVQALDDRTRDRGSGATAATPAGPLWCVTRGAQPVAATGSALALTQGPLWGLARVAMLEHPHLAVRLVDLDPAADGEDAAACLAAALAAPDPETLVAYRDGRRYGARLERVAAPPPGRAAEAPATGLTLITGGLGGLGLQLAAWLVAGGCRHLVLIGRRPPDARAARQLASLRAQGATVETPYRRRRVRGTRDRP